MHYYQRLILLLRAGQFIIITHAYEERVCVALVFTLMLVAHAEQYMQGYIQQHKDIDSDSML